MQENLSTSNFKKNIIFVFKVLVFIILILPLIYYLGNKYSIASTENLINTYNEKRFNEFYQLDKNTLDMVFLGSSHSYCSFDPEIFDNELGINSYQMGMPLQHLDSTYYTLKEMLNYQSPKLAVIEVYWDMLDDEFELKQANMLFQVLKNKELEQQYIKDVFPLSEKVKYSVKLFKYQQDYFAFKSNDMKKSIESKFNVIAKIGKKQQGIEEYRSKGYTYCDYNMLESEFNKTNQFRNFDAKNWSMNSAQQKYLQKIIDTCKDNNIDIIFVTAPIANVSMDFILNYDVINNTVQGFADKNNIPYFDYNIINKNEKLFNNNNFRDDAHLNHSGVEILDKHFIETLKEHDYFK